MRSRAGARSAHLLQQETSARLAFAQTLKIINYCYFPENALKNNCEHDLGLMSKRCLCF